MNATPFGQTLFCKSFRIPLLGWVQGWVFRYYLSRVLPNNPVYIHCDVQTGTRAPCPYIALPNNPVNIHCDVQTGTRAPCPYIVLPNNPASIHCDGDVTSTKFAMGMEYPPMTNDTVPSFSSSTPSTMPVDVLSLPPFLPL